MRPARRRSGGPTDEAAWMRRALRLASRGRGRTSPNPMVGAVIVKGGRVVGEGWHRELGGPHAEVNALQAAGGAARGATVYVTLEPCCHWGRTPPCTEALIGAGVARVVAACRDPDPRVNGEGLAALRAAGITAQVGLLETEAQELNEAYLKHAVTGQPFVALKAAMTLDGKIATAAGESKWITGERARAYGRRLRSWHDAVLTGVETVRADDPELTARVQGRARGGREPLRVAADSRARTPPTARLLAAASRAPVIAVTEHAPAARRRRLEAAGAQVWVLPSQGGRVNLGALVERLGELGVQSVLVESGGTLAAAVLEAGLVDRVYFFVAPRLVGGRGALTPIEGEGRALSQAWGVERIRVRRVGEDLLITGRVAG